MLATHIRATLVTLLLDFTYWSGVCAADSFLSDHLIRKDQVQNVLEHQPATKPACEHIPTGPIETTMCDYETIESVNKDLYHNLQQLVNTPFFKYFQVDLYRECPFWEENGSCMNRECGITTVDESEIPERWRAAALSKIESSSLEKRNSLPGCYYRDSDFCFLDDMTEGDYVDLSVVPEHYTGYSGEKAHRVWRAIYEENCFGLSEYDIISGRSSAGLPDTMNEHLGEGDEQCLEKRVYYKVISGLHASISTHICHGDLNQTTGERRKNLQCFVTRVASHPERLQYIYFNTVLLLRAVARIGPYLSAYDYCAQGTHEDDAETLEKVAKVITMASDVGSFDETVLFRGENANILKEEFKEHFRNVSRIMDCVGCDKCRLWGKVQTTGLGTALKILFELDEKALDPHSNVLHRSEVVALINTLHRFSESLEAVNDFRTMWAETSAKDSAKLIHEAEAATSTHARPRPSPLAGYLPRPKNLLVEIRTRLQALTEACKDGTAECVGILVDVWERCLKALSSLFQPSRKADGLFGEL